MLAAKQRDTSVELLLRRALYAQGLRFRIHQRVIPGLRRHADIVFRKAKVAVFVDGCFWHSCPKHGTLPKANAQWWAEKLKTNRNRDRDTVRRLREAGWRVFRIWEHDNATRAAARIARTVHARCA